MRKKEIIKKMKELRNIIVVSLIYILISINILLTVNMAFKFTSY